MDNKVFEEKIERTTFHKSGCNLMTSVPNDSFYCTCGATILKNYEVIHNLRAQVESLSKPVDGWQPIETAPKDGTYIILYGNSYYPQGIMPKKPDLIGIVKEGEFCAGSWQIGGRTIEPTHWQPLPPPINASPTPIDADKDK